MTLEVGDRIQAIPSGNIWEVIAIDNVFGEYIRCTALADGHTCTYHLDDLKRFFVKIETKMQGGIVPGLPSGCNVPILFPQMQLPVSTLNNLLDAPKLEAIAVLSPTTYDPYKEYDDKFGDW